MEAVDAPLLALGIISAPANSVRRAWIRRHVKLASNAAWLAARFVLGNSTAVDDGEAQHIDVLFVDAVDNPINVAAHKAHFSTVGIVRKTLLWYMHAVHKWPRASFVAKCDDDTFL